MRLLKLLPGHTKIDFVKMRFFAFGLDGLLVLISIFALAMYGLNLGIDFTGGVLVEVKAMQSIDIADMRQRVESLNFAEAQLQNFGGGDCEMPPNSCVLIRVLPEAGTTDQVAANMIQAQLGEGYAFRRTEVVGPKVSSELLTAGILAAVAAVRMSLRDLINTSTNQVLHRTVLASVTTSISIIPLLMFWGPTLFDFTAAILFGIVVGTFSSIYVAAALLLYLPPITGREESVDPQAARPGISR